jgi:hypothetical protein
MSETQKKILKQVGVSQSQYMQNIASLHSNVNNTNEGAKNSSYERYLNRKKGKVLSNQGKTTSEPIYGNKSQSVSLTSKNISVCSSKLCN